MKQFDGFPARMDFTPLPNLFFSALLPQIDDMAELKTTLHALAALYRKRGYPRFVSFNELLGDAGLMGSLGGAAQAEETLRGALDRAVERGTFIRVSMERGGEPEEIYLLNAASERQVAAKIENGELELGGLKVVARAFIPPEALPDIFVLYEQNIGMLTPLIAEELREAERTYPDTWIREAIKEAVSLNKRSIRYIIRILESWSAEGRSDGTHRRGSKTDRDKYIKGKYGHIVGR